MYARYLESTILCPEPVIICGDFNVHMDNVADTNNTQTLNDLLNSMSLKQHVTLPTHVHGPGPRACFGFNITRLSDTIVLDAPRIDSFLSDHATVLCNLNMMKSELTVKKVTFRKFKSINIDQFKNDLCASSLICDAPLDLDRLAYMYNNTLASVLNTHAPLRSRTVVTRAQVPWFTDEIREAKRLRRRAERKWRLSVLDVDLKAFKFQKNKTTYMYIMNKTCCEFYTDFIDKNCVKNQRKLFSAVKQLLNQDSDTLFPQNCNKLNLANQIGSYFVKKITDIRVGLDKLGVSVTVSPAPMPVKIQQIMHSFMNLRLLGEDSVRKLVLKVPSKSCIFDPVPTFIVKDCINELLPSLTSIINMSLQSGMVPGLDTGFANLRPISNLQFVSKLVETCCY